MKKVKKVTNLKNINDLFSKIDGERVDELVAGTENTGAEEQPNVYKTSPTTSLVTIISYLIGMDEGRMDMHYASSNRALMDELKNNRAATIIRYLCRLRNALMLHFKKADNDMLYQLSNIDKMPWFSSDEILQLREWGIEVIRPNYRADKYCELFTDLIADHIDDCKGLFPEWVKYEYVRDLFFAPKYKKPDVLKEEYNKFRGNLNSYPFQMYIHWKPTECGNLLRSDGKFLSVLYEQHGEVFVDKSKYRDAAEGTKRSIYDYIDSCRRVMIVVDCENSDVYKLYGVLKNLAKEELEKIEKIVLYDDFHTSAGWDWLEKFISIPVEHVEVERVVNHKSLVDMRMAAGICQAFYRDGISSFILCSSDSDFWGVISAIPEADFLVMYEYQKCGKDIKDALTERNIYHCAMDDFYTGNAWEIKKVVLKKSLEKEVADPIGKNGYDIARKVFAMNHIDATESEIKTFYEKYVQTLRLKIDEQGCFYVDILD